VRTPRSVSRCGFTHALHGMEDSGRRKAGSERLGGSKPAASRSSASLREQARSSRRCTPSKVSRITRRAPARARPGSPALERPRSGIRRDGAGAPGGRVVCGRAGNGRQGADPDVPAGEQAQRDGTAAGAHHVVMGVGTTRRASGRASAIPGGDVVRSAAAHCACGEVGRRSGGPNSGEPGDHFINRSLRLDLR
jgi:hypothetical protein